MRFQNLERERDVLLRRAARTTLDVLKTSAGGACEGVLESGGDVGVECERDEGSVERAALVIAEELSDDLRGDGVVEAARPRHAREALARARVVREPRGRDDALARRTKVARVQRGPRLHLRPKSVSICVAFSVTTVRFQPDSDFRQFNRLARSASL